MAICAQKPDVFLVGGPVREAPRPRVITVFRPDFPCRVDMVNVQSSMVVEAALGTFSAKRRDQRELPCPITRVSMHAVPMLIPIVLLASWRTEPCFRWLAAFFAFAGIRPPVREVTGATTEFASAIFQPIRVHRHQLFAVLANDFNWLVSHASKYITGSERKYFDIACERIENAYKQQRLFA